VGKTTLSANLAWCAATISSRKTLLWDMDAAGGAGFLFGIEPNGTKLAEGVFTKDTKPDKLLRHTGFEGLGSKPNQALDSEHSS
jgi:chromosome partitioning protein